MKVLIVNTSEKTGGAALAANRLKDALNNNGVKAKMLVRDKLTDDITVVGLSHTLRNQLHFLWERWTIFWHLHFSRKHLFEIDIANSGVDITKLPEFKEADIIHLSWINQGMLSLKGIRKILDSGKPVVWTMHDIWPATGICHITLNCLRYQSYCGNCRFLPNGGSTNDLSNKVLQRKKKMLEGRNIMFITCSKWLEKEASKSAILAGQQVFSIPNPIDTHVFHPTDRKQARINAGLPLDKKIILFASQRVTNVNKGISYLIEACHKLAKDYPEIVNKTAIAILGGHAENLREEFDFEVYELGYINDTQRIVDVYNASDVFVLPSLSENLPNTIMEAMACGVPCVGFKVGGIPEEIDHKVNGYVAKYRDATDLAQGLHWILEEADYQDLSSSAITKVQRSYSQRSVALQYINIYNEAMAFKNYRL